MGEVKTVEEERQVKMLPFFENCASMSLIMRTVMEAVPLWINLSLSRKLLASEVDWGEENRCHKPIRPRPEFRWFLVNLAANRFLPALSRPFGL